MDRSEKLIIDVGNTRTKAAIFEGRMLKELHHWPNDLETLRNNVNQLSLPTVISSVVHTNEDLIHEFDNNPLILSAKTPLPIQIDYDTPETLGIDRIAGVVGANAEFSGKDILLIDLGTCITYDYLTHEGIYQGGAISPGFEMRMGAMHHMTRQLPDIRKELENIEFQLPGKSTKECMRQGAEQGLLHELTGFMNSFRQKVANPTIVITGGNAQHFESYIKEPIFVRPEILLMGLNTILDYNEVV